MAYNASNIDSDQTQVAGSTPLSQGDGAATPTQQPQEGDSMPSNTPATIQPGASVNNASSQGQTKSKAAPKASSGMFTNIQNYVQKNQPQAQKMAQAVTTDVSKQAAGIRQAAEQKQAQQQTTLGANTRAMEVQRQEAQGLVNQATGAAPAQPGVIDKTESQRFQSLIKGPQLQDVQDINLAQQNMRSQALQNLTKGANREQGRRNLMRETFGDRGYTRGQSGLDELILGGSQDAVGSLIGGVQGESKALQDKLQGIGQQSVTDIAAQAKQAGNFGQSVEDLAMNPYNDIMSSGKVEAKRRMDAFGTDQIAFEEALKSGNITPEMMDQYISEDQYGSLIGEATKRRDTLADYISGSQAFKTSNKASRYADLAGLDKDSLMQRQSDYITEKMGPQQSYEDYKKDGGSSGKSQFNFDQRMRNITQNHILGKEFKENLGSQVGGQEINKATIQAQLAELAKSGGLQQYLSGPSASNINAQNVSTPEQTAQQAALAKLAGVTNQWTPESYTGAPTGAGQFNVDDIEGLYSNLFKV